MDLAVAFLALAISAVSLGAAIRFGRALTEAQASLRDIRRDHERMQREQADIHGAHEQIRREHEQIRREHEQIHRELGELKAAADMLPAPPPLPKARTGGLDDLRQQLRQAHAEDSAEPTEP